MVGNRTCFDAGWPTDEQRDAVTTFIDVGLGAAPNVIRLVFIGMVTNYAEVFDVVRLVFVDTVHE